MKKIIALYLLIFSTLISDAYAQDANIYDVPRPVPSHPIRNDYGKEFNLKSFKGSFLVVLFWSKNCSVCLKTMDELAAFQESVKNDGIKVIIISSESDWTGASQRQKVLRKIGGESLDSYVDIQGNLAESFGIFSHPNTVIVNSKGYEIGRIRGSVDWNDKDVIQKIYKIKAENNNKMLEKPDISIKKIMVRDI